MKDLCEEIREYFDENSPSWYDSFNNKFRRMLIHESIRIKKEKKLSNYSSFIVNKVK
jgi:hypothetical protein